MASGSAGVQAIAGLAAIALGVLALAGSTEDLVLNLVALLALGSTLVLTGSSLSATVMLHADLTRWRAHPSARPHPPAKKAASRRGLRKWRRRAQLRKPLRKRRQFTKPKSMSVLFVHFLIPQDNRWRPNAAQLCQLINRLIDDKFIPPHGENDRWAKCVLNEQPDGSEEPDSVVIELPQLPPNGPLRFLSKWLAGAFPAPQAKIPLDPRRWAALPEEIETALASVAAMIEWNVPAPSPLGIRSPLLMPLYKQGDYRISIWLSQHFNFSHNDAYGGVDESRYLRTQCACSEELYFEPPWDKARSFVFGGGVLADCPRCGKAFAPGEQMVGMVNGFTGEEYLISGGLCFRFAIAIDCDRDSPEPNPDESVDHILGERRVSPAFLDACRDALGVEFRQISFWT